ALTADRMPGVPQIWAALIALISEGFEDAHYFLGHHDHNHDHNHNHHHAHNHEHHHEHKQLGAHQHHEHAHHDLPHLLKEHLETNVGHNHNDDIPSRILKTITIPLYALAATWDCLASKLNKSSDSINNKKRTLTFTRAWDKQRGNKKEVDVNLPVNVQKTSAEWQMEHSLFLIQKYEKKHLNKIVIGSTIAKEKKQELLKLQKTLREADVQSLPGILKETEKNAVLHQHRLFAYPGKQTSTQIFIEKLPQRVGITSAA
ncbi:MAG: hypothetical protein WA877_10800, partial [Legionella sp.]